MQKKSKKNPKWRIDEKTKNNKDLYQELDLEQLKIPTGGPMHHVMID